MRKNQNRVRESDRLGSANFLIFARGGARSAAINWAGEPRQSGSGLKFISGKS